MISRSIVALLLLMSACLNPRGRIETMEAQRRTIHSGSYGGVAWLMDGSIVFTNNEDPDGDGEPRLWMMEGQDSKPKLLSISEPTDCLRHAQLAPVALADGRLSFLSSCWRRRPDDSGHLEELLVMAYDPESGSTTRLVEESLSLGIGRFAWNLELERGIYATANDPCVVMVWLTPEGMEIPDIEIREGARGWNLKESFAYPDRVFDCDDLGLASWPDWSPDGNTIAFFAAPEAAGEQNLSRLDVPFNLYFMDPEEQLPEKILEEVVHPQALRFSPDGEWLAFGGTIRGDEGTWIYHHPTDDLIRIADSIENDLAWSPDGLRIVASYSRGVLEGPIYDDLVIMDASDIVRER